MSDIVERLRDPYERSAWGATLCSDAADEIERLRGLLREASGKLDLTEHSELFARIESELATVRDAP